MVVRGRVQNGVVVLDEGARLPEGEEVTVLTKTTSLSGSRADGLRPHSVLDITTINLGEVIQPLGSDDDLLGEMLEGRP